MARTAVRVNSVSQSPWNGPVYNIGVDEDESFTVRGVATHNCHCRLVLVPPGFAFNAEWQLVPLAKAA